MPVDRTLWKHPPLKHSEHLRHQWRCPSCDSGYLHLKVETLHFAETRKSRKARDQEEWNLEDNAQIYRFSGILECSIRRCSEVVVVSGYRHNYVETYHSTDPDSGKDEYDVFDVEDFYVDYVSPSPPLITVPENCPTALKAELDKAFVASWGDWLAAANHIRSGIEKLLDHLGEPKITTNQKGKCTTLSLHQRIQSLKNRDEQCGTALLAVKWVGNAGSHADDISREKVYDAFDIIEVVLKDVFSRDYSKVAKSVDAINKWASERR
jgi:hypothetical protein